MTREVMSHFVRTFFSFVAPSRGSSWSPFVVSIPAVVASSVALVWSLFPFCCNGFLLMSCPAFCFLLSSFFTSHDFFLLHWDNCFWVQNPSLIMFLGWTVTKFLHIIFRDYYLKSDNNQETKLLGKDVWKETSVKVSIGCFYSTSSIWQTET